jgi:hypothetical protein
MILRLILILIVSGAAMAKEGTSPSGVPKNVVEVLGDLYRAAQTRFQQMVLHPTGTETGAPFNQARAAQQLQQVDAIVRELKVRSNAWVGKQVPAVYKTALALADKQAAEVGIRPEGSAIQGSFNLIDHPTVRIFARDMAVDLFKASDSMGETTKKILRQTAQLKLGESEIDRILAGGVIDGQPAQTIQALRKALEKAHGGKLVTIINKNGDPMSFDAKDYAEMVARTKTREAAVTARHGRLEELGLDLVMIIGRISENFCTGFLGKVYSLSGTSPKYPAYSSLPFGGPPFHPNCSKGTRPFVDELASKKQIAAAKPDEDTLKLLQVKDTGSAQRTFKDLQLRQQVESRYATTEKKLFG